MKRSKNFVIVFLRNANRLYRFKDGRLRGIYQLCEQEKQLAHLSMKELEM